MRLYNVDNPREYLQVAERHVYKMEDLISVIVPIYRIEQYLEQCIQSIQNQTYKNLEIILVDDGSDDTCPQICDRYAQDDVRIKVIHKENGGLDSARKAGMKAATGKYIGYVDGDDWIEPNMYEKLITYANKYNVDVVESGVIDSWVDNEKQRTPYLKEGCYKGTEFTNQVESKLLYAGFFYRHGIEPYLCSKLFLKEKVEKYQMIQDLVNVLYDDIMISMPCIAESKSIYISHDCYYHYRVREDSLKRTYRADDVSNLIKCYPEFYKRFKGTLLCSENDKQIKYYTMYLLLHKSLQAFDNSCSEYFLTPFGGIKKNAGIVLYGAGAVGIHMKNYISSVEGSNIVGWLDINYKDMQNSLGVRNPQDIASLTYDYVVISILRESAVKSAKKDLINLGVPEEKILWIEQKFLDDPELLISKVIQ